MTTIRRRAASLLPALLATGCAGARPELAAPAPERSLGARIEAVMSAPPLHRTSWGVLFADAATGRTLYAMNPELHFIPASNTKLVVSIVALGTLGPEWRYRTEVHAVGLDAEGGARELRIAGRGDPTFSARFHGRELAALEAIADSIAAAGVRRAGTLVIDASYFTDAQVHSTWEVGDLPDTYAAPVSAFGVEEGTFALELRGGAQAGDTATAAVLVPLHAAHVGAPQPLQATLRTDTAGARTRTASDYTARFDTLYLDGVVAASAIDTVRLAVIDPPAFAGRALAHVLARRGVAVDNVRVERRPGSDAAATPHVRSLFTLSSAPLADVVAAILQPSQNWIAEQLLKTLGAERGTEGSWSGGLAVERAYLGDVVGIDTLAFNLRDGSGLSAQNLLTPSATVQLLQHARNRPWAAQLRSALAAPGLAGSTLENRLPALAGRLVAKTGTISNVSSLSGYLTTDGGRELVFSILTNGSGLPSATVRAATDSIVLMVAREVK